LWNFGDNDTSTAINPIHHYTDTGTHIVTLKAFSNIACGNSMDSSTTIIIIHPNPAAAIIGNSPFCAGDSTTLNAGTFSQYIWNNGSTTQSINVSNPNTFLVTVTDANGCTGTASKTVTVNPLPTPVITPSGPTAFCQGDSISLNAGIFSSYSWNNTATTQSIFVSNQATYMVTVTDSNGCKGIASITDSVIPPPIVISAFAVDTHSGCKPLFVPFTNTSTNATSYLWKFSGGGGSSTLTNPIHSYSHSGMDTVTLIAYDSTACGIFSDTSTQAYYFTVYNIPLQPTITAHGDTLTTTYYNSYQWFKFPNPSIIDTNQTYIVTDTGCYYVEVKDTNGCYNKSDSICFYSLTGLPNITSNHGISIYPNPANTILNIHCQLSSRINRDNCQLSITNLLGQEIHKQTLIGIDNRIDISKWSEGLYFYEIRGTNETSRGKFIIQK
jgi:PKD repeat protein